MAQNEENPSAPAEKQENPMPAPSAPTSSNKNMVIASLAVLVLLVVVVSYFSFHSKPKSSTSTKTNSVTEPANVSPAVVNITGTNFTPATVYIKVGQGVVWTNTDSANHSIASDNPHPLFDSGVLATNDTFSFVFNKAGNYPYHDNSNTRLAGIIVVR